MKHVNNADRTETKYRQGHIHTIQRDAIQSNERNGVNTMAVQYIAVSWKPDASSMQRKALQAKVRKANARQCNAVHIKAIQSSVSKAM